MRKHNFVIGEYYHIYNRGSDKRDIILDYQDLLRFKQTLEEFNTTKPIKSLYVKSFKKSVDETDEKLIEFIAYCINPNHFHLLVTPLIDKGVEKFMQRIGGYTRYFNEKYKRNGVLFQGKFKSKHVNTNEYLVHLSAYINYNNQPVLSSPTTKYSLSSLNEYILTSVKHPTCNTKIVLEQFKSKKDYQKYAESAWKDIQKRKEELQDFEFE